MAQWRIDYRVQKFALAGFEGKPSDCFDDNAKKPIYLSLQSIFPIEEKSAISRKEEENSSFIFVL